MPEIDGAQAWAELCRHHSVDVTAERRHDWSRVTGRAGPWVVPDWATIARDYHGVHLTAAAYLGVAGTPIRVDGRSASLVAGWNPDQTYWLSDVPVPAPGQVWALGERVPPEDTEPDDGRRWTAVGEESSHDGRERSPRPRARRRWFRR